MDFLEKKVMWNIKKYYGYGACRCYPHISYLAHMKQLHTCCCTPACRHPDFLWC